MKDEYGGTMKESECFVTKGGILTEYRGCDRNVIIPNWITIIDNYAFAKHPELESVTISEGVSNIGDGAFLECSGLTNIIIPNSVLYIGFMAFSECTKLNSITIPKATTDLGPLAFDHCDGLKQIVMLNGDFALEPLTLGNSDMTIVAPAGGAVEKVAKEYGFKFEPLDSDREHQ